MIKKILYLVNFSLLVFVTKFSFAQVTLQGVVMDTNEKPIPYANIVVATKKLGTFSDEAGRFELKTTHLEGATVVAFSCLGFKTEERSVKQLLDGGSKIMLKEKEKRLDEVVLQVRKLKTYKKGKTRFKNTDLIRYGSSFREAAWNQPGHELGMKFSLGSSKTSHLKEVAFYIKRNAFKYAVVRLNIYSLKQGKPMKKLSNVIVKLKDHFTGWKTVALSELGLRVKEDVVLSIEFLNGSPKCYENPGGCGLFLSYYPTWFSPPMYSKAGVNSSWEVAKGRSLTMTLSYKQ